VNFFSQKIMHWQLGQKIRTALNCLLSQAPTLPEQVMSMPGIMTRRTEVKNAPADSRKRKRQESQKRELPTRHSLLTDVAVADLEDAQASKSPLVMPVASNIHYPLE
jgi:hypothetical protein